MLFMCDDNHRAQNVRSRRQSQMCKKDRLQYLKTLGQKRFIGFVLEGEEGPPDPGKASGKRWVKK